MYINSKKCKNVSAISRTVWGVYVITFHVKLYDVIIYPYHWKCLAHANLQLYQLQMVCQLPLWWFHTLVTYSFSSVVWAITPYKNLFSETKHVKRRLIQYKSSPIGVWIHYSYTEGPQNSVCHSTNLQGDKTIYFISLCCYMRLIGLVPKVSPVCGATKNSRYLCRQRETRAYGPFRPSVTIIGRHVDSFFGQELSNKYAIKITNIWAQDRPDTPCLLTLFQRANKDGIIDNSLY